MCHPCGFKLTSARTTCFQIHFNNTPVSSVCFHTQFSNIPLSSTCFYTQFSNIPVSSTCFHTQFSNIPVPSTCFQIDFTKGYCMMIAFFLSIALFIFGLAVLITWRVTDNDTAKVCSTFTNILLHICPWDDWFIQDKHLWCTPITIFSFAHLYATRHITIKVTAPSFLDFIGQSWIFPL